MSIPLIILTPLPLDFIYELQLYKGKFTCNINIFVINVIYLSLEIGSSQFKQFSQVKIVSLVKDNWTLNEIKV